MSTEGRKSKEVETKEGPEEEYDEEEEEETKVESFTEKKYRQFITEYKRGWCLFNVGMCILSLTLGISSISVVTHYEVTDCDSTCLQYCNYVNIETGIWIVAVLHFMNFIETILNIAGIELKVCSGIVFCGYFALELSILIYMQVIYF